MTAVWERVNASANHCRLARPLVQLVVKLVGIMITVGAFEAKTHLSALLDKVAEGEEVLITKHGKPVARMVKAEASSREEAGLAIAKLKALRVGVTLDLDWRSLRDEGRR